ncbi:glycoside hydrolase family 9 protein [Vibrio ostreicida]|uniref:glycoside hydrolase family 9 protein n=1 Tax=Vibrio ostreicida TaxID=526588 RepID=UPI0009709177|nr:glycoside hydrolase family 9 protein [Vibrio ostreicida]
MLLVNHIGYETQGPKHAVFIRDQACNRDCHAYLICADTQQTVATLNIPNGTLTDQWQLGHASRIEFSDFQTNGRYYLNVANLNSNVFVIAKGLLLKETLSDVLHYFKSQRSGGRFDQRDHSVPLIHSDDNVDVHGGWYDASGDVSKYLSHLSYSNYLNPQQTPMVVWNMLKGLELLSESNRCPPFSQWRLAEEALFGADFLVRMQNQAGFFYMTVFDQWSKDVDQREVCAYATQKGHKTNDVESGFRQGGGMAIAALSAAARLTERGEFSQYQYQEAAEKGYWHLKEFNHHYINDGEENIIDEYCALLAAVELYRTTSKRALLDECRQWSTKLQNRQQSDDNFSYFWSANANGSRPFYHAVEAGLPVIALCEYLKIETDPTRKQSAIKTINQAIQFELTITRYVDNPFQYPRQYVQSLGGIKRDAFFMAQNNETGYWWQGENARLASLSTMAYFAFDYIENINLKEDVMTLSHSALNWILGLNPYDLCMLDGHGRNNPNYLPDLGFFNAKGGICNGITAGFNDEQGIAFNPLPHKFDLQQNWRWGEQWLPHAGWYLIAIIAQFNHFDAKN